jgi:uncharacterized protein
MAPTLPDLSHLAVSGSEIALRVTPRAGREAIEPGDPLRVRVTAPPEDGKANDAVRRLLARAMGVAPTRLTLIRGATARDKLFRLD